MSLVRRLTSDGQVITYRLPGTHEGAAAHGVVGVQEEGVDEDLVGVVDCSLGVAHVVYWSGAAHCMTVGWAGVSCCL